MDGCTLTYPSLPRRKGLARLGSRAWLWKPTATVDDQGARRDLRRAVALAPGKQMDMFNTLETRPCFQRIKARENLYSPEDGLERVGLRNICMHCASIWEFICSAPSPPNPHTLSISSCPNPYSCGCWISCVSSLYGRTRYIKNSLSAQRSAFLCVALAMTLNKCNTGNWSGLMFRFCFQ